MIEPTTLKFLNERIADLTKQCESRGSGSLSSRNSAKLASLTLALTGALAKLLIAKGIITAVLKRLY